MSFYYFLALGGLFALLLRMKWFADLWQSFKYQFNYNGIATLSAISDGLSKATNQLDGYPNKQGEVAIVTGGYAGLGLEVTRMLLRCKMHVVVASRNKQKGEEVIEQLNNEGLPGTASFMVVDVGSMKSVERFAQEFKAKYDRLDVLVNNAAIIFGPHRITEDKFEMQLATNYIGHFYLTHLLMGHLIKSGRPDKVSRVVNVASCAHYGIHMFFEDFNMEKTYHPTAGYARSKMAQILSTRYLNKMFQDRQLPVKMYAAHPGIVATGMFYNTPETSWMSFMGGLFKTPAQGAVPVTYCAISPKMEQRGGAYISNCVEGYTDGYSKNPENMERLYHMTRKMLDIKEFGKAD